MARFNKLWVALASATAVGVSLTADGSVSISDGFAIAAAFFGALCVGAIPNKTV